MKSGFFSSSKKAPSQQQAHPQSKRNTLAHGALPQKSDSSSRWGEKKCSFSGDGRIGFTLSAEAETPAHNLLGPDFPEVEETIPEDQVFSPGHVSSNGPIYSAQGPHHQQQKGFENTLNLDQSGVDRNGQQKNRKAPRQGTQLGDYLLLQKLGQGGMGAVYRAKNQKLDKVVALKVLSSELGSKKAFVERFQREARLMAKLDHPNILRCLAIGATGGKHFLAMEYLDGGSVQTHLSRLGRLSLGDALRIVLATAAALEYAHGKKMVHRDIKPDNILLSARGGIKVADFGLAKAADDLCLTATGTCAGTPVFMAPEQARDVKRVDHRADIYSLGIMLYVMLTGKAPFGGQNLVEVTRAKDHGRFPPIRRFNQDVPEKLDLIVGKMLAPKPEHRYSSCAALIRDLERLGLANKDLRFLKGLSKNVVSSDPVQAPLTGGPMDLSTDVSEIKTAKEKTKVKKNREPQAPGGG